MTKPRSEHLSSGPSGQLGISDQEQTALDFGDSYQDVPEVVSEDPNWAADPRAAVRSWMVEKAYGERSITQYVAMIGAACDHWQTQGKGTSILSATVTDMEEFLRKPNARGQVSSDGTRRRYLGLLQSVLDHLVEVNLRTDNPARELLQLPANSIVERADPIFLLPNEMDQLQAALYDGSPSDWLTTRDRALIGVFAGAGLTASEAQSLSAANVAIHRAEITLYVDHRSEHRRRHVALAAWSTQLMLDWLRARQEIAPKLNLHRSGGPLFPASLKSTASQETTVPSLRPARALSDTEIYTTVAEVLSKISATAAAVGPQTLRNTYATTRLIGGAKDAKLLTDLGLETSFTLDVLRKQLVEKGLICFKKRA